MCRKLATMLATLLAFAPFVSQAATLYEQLGGAEGVKTIVDRSVARYMADPLVGPTFAESNMDRFRQKMAEFICVVADGPCHYTGVAMAESHRGLHLDRAQFNAATEDLQAAMTESGIGFQTQNKLIAKLAPMQRDVVTR